MPDKLASRPCYRVKYLIEGCLFLYGCLRRCYAGDGHAEG